MRRLFIFAIGGTGARVLRSLDMILAADGEILDPESKVVPIIIDYDVNNGDKKRTIDQMTLYSKISHDIYDTRRNVYNNEYPKQGFFSTKMVEMGKLDQDHLGTSTFNLRYDPDPNSKKYSDSIDYNSLNGNLMTTKYLIDSLYNTSTDQEFAELHIDTTVGFRGNPNIGSVMFKDIEKSPEYREFVHLCDAAQDDRVVIIGSLFGGTGSSGIPVLVNAIRSNRSNAINNVKIATILVCPYFKIGEPSDRSEGVIDDKIFESKTKASLHYYKATLNDKIDSIYYLGDTSKENVDHNIGKEAQKNPAHIVELASALSVCHFATYPSGDFDRKNNEWKYGLEVDVDDVNKLDFSMFSEATQNVIRHFITYSIAGKYIKDYLLNNYNDVKKLNFFVFSGFGKNVDELSEEQKRFRKVVDDFMIFYGYYKDWMGELESAGAHSLENFDFDSKELCDIIRSFPFRKENKKVFGKATFDPTLVPKDLNQAMSDYYKKNFQPEGKDKELNPAESLEYAFFRTLYMATMSVVIKNLNLKKN